MAAGDNILRTYSDTSIKEDVLGLVEVLTAKENWFLTNLGKTKANNTVHQTLYDTLRTTASAAVQESADYTALARTTASRFTNIIQHVAIPFKVSRTQQHVEHFSGNELARQTKKALVEWGNAAEYDLVRSTLTSGASGTAPTMSKRLTQCLIRCIMDCYKLIYLYAKKTIQMQTLCQKVLFIRKKRQILFT